MSYPHGFYDLSHSTTHEYNWELEPDQVTAQPQHLSPTTQHQQQQQQQQQLQPQQRQQPQQFKSQLYHVPPTIQLQERMTISQYRFDNITEEHFLQQAAASADERRSDTSSRRRATSKPPLRGNTALHSSVSPGGSSVGAGPSTMPMRVPHGRRVPSSHPYGRSPVVGREGASESPVAAVRPVPERETAVGLQARLSSGSSRALMMPPGASGLAVSCPAVNLWRGRIVRAPNVGIASTSHTSTPSTTPTTAQTPLPHAQEGAPTQSNLPAQAHTLKRFTVCTDVHFDPLDNILVAMFELPGMKKSDLHITLATCPYSHVTQLTVAGVSHPVLTGERGHTLRERKFGEFARSLVVPPGTKPQDIKAVMEDGVLTLRIPGGRIAQTEPPRNVLIS